MFNAPLEDTADSTYTGETGMSTRMPPVDQSFNILSHLILPPRNFHRFVMLRIIHEVLKQSDFCVQSLPRVLRPHFRYMQHVCQKLKRVDAQVGPMAPVKDYSAVLLKLGRFLPYHLVLNKTLRDTLDDFQLGRFHKIKLENVSAYKSAITQMLQTSNERLSSHVFSFAPQPQPQPRPQIVAEIAAAPLHKSRPAVVTSAS